ncbi:uncharacterized protein [Ptychodera flava]|uniref:uncharacterized protein n=1 Tax=Ptychodera flava TaxID=63121 RepID=UPI00396A623A
MNSCGGTHCVEAELQRPCDSHECQHEAETCVDMKSHSICTCVTACPDYYAPVCGKIAGLNFAQEYYNECHMTMKACQTKAAIKKVNCKSYHIINGATATTQPTVLLTFVTSAVLLLIRLLLYDV